MLVAVLAVIIGLAIGITLKVAPQINTINNKSMTHYSEQQLQIVQETAQSELTKRGLIGEVATLGYGHQEIDLGFWQKANPEVVSIVQSIIAEKTPGVPLVVVENVKVVTQSRSASY